MGQRRKASRCSAKSFREKSSSAFLSEVPPCLVVMEACGSAHHWGRHIIALGHRCKLIPPIYVKPFLKRQKNDSHDAAAIVEAAQRPTWTHPGKVEAPYTVCIASASNLTGLVKSSVECRRTGL